MVPKITLLVRNYLSFFASDSSHMVVWASSSYIRWRQKLWGWGINRNIFFSPQKDLWSPNLLKTRQVYWCAGVKLVVRLLPDHWWCPCGGVVRPPPRRPQNFVRKFSSALHHRGPTKSCPLGGGGKKPLGNYKRPGISLFCQGPASLALLSNLERRGVEGRLPRRGQRQGLGPAQLLRAGSHALPLLLCQPPPWPGRRKYTARHCRKMGQKAVELILSSLRTPPLIYPKGLFLPSKLRDNETQEDLH